MTIPECPWHRYFFHGVYLSREKRRKVCACYDQTNARKTPSYPVKTSAVALCGHLSRVQCHRIHNTAELVGVARHMRWPCVGVRVGVCACVTLFRFDAEQLPRSRAGSKRNGGKRYKIKGERVMFGLQWVLEIISNDSSRVNSQGKNERGREIASLAPRYR